MNQCPHPADQPRPVPAGDQPPHPRPAANLLRPYLRRTQDWARFDDQAARADGLSEDLLRVGREVNRFGGQLAAPEGQERELLPGFHGNWCGPGHSGPGEPVDRLDAACMAHDLCYRDDGYFNRDCDLALLRAIESDWDDYTRRQRFAAAAIYAVFTLKTGWSGVGAPVEEPH